MAQTVLSWIVPFAPGTKAQSYFVAVDGMGGEGDVLECDGSDNDASTVSAECPALPCPALPCPALPCPAQG